MTVKLRVSLKLLLACFLLNLLASCGGGGGGDGSSTTAVVGPAASPACIAKRSVVGYDVVLLIGQSNMSGYGAYLVPGFDTTDPRIQQWSHAQAIILASDPLEHPDAPFNAGRIGPGMSFARTYIKTLPTTRKVLLVPAAVKATGFSDSRWNPGNDLFEDALARTNAALATDTGNCLAAILWSQGETDVGRMTSATYQAALDAMINAIRSRVTAGSGADAAPFILGQFSPDWIAPTPSADQQAILSVINATTTRQRYTAIASTAGLTSNLTQGLDGAIHLDAASHRIYGTRFFDGLALAVANSAAR